MKKAECDVLHITDLHYSMGNKGSNSQFLDYDKENTEPQFRSKVKKVMDDVLSELIRKDRRFDAICMTGDFTLRGDESGFKEIEERLIPKLKKLTQSEAAICCVPGNHDVAWRLDRDDKELFSKKFELYSNFIDDNHLTSSFIPAGNLLNSDIDFRSNSNPIYVNKRKKLIVLCINSAIRSGEINPYRREKIESEVLGAEKVYTDISNKADHNIKIENELDKLKGNLDRLKEISIDMSLFDITQITPIQLGKLRDEIYLRQKEIGKELWEESIKVVMLHHHVTIFENQINEHKAFEMCSDAANLFEFLSEHQFNVILTGHKHQPYFVKRQFNNSTFFIIGGTTVAGTPVMGEKPGMQIVNIKQENGNLEVNVTKLPLNKELFNGNKYLNSLDSQCLKSITQQTGLPIFQLRDKEKPNQILQSVKKVEIVALTFHSLSEDLSKVKGETKFNQLSDLVMKVYSYRTQINYHPIISNKTELKKEWEKGISKSINILLNEKLFPNLINLELVVLSSLPYFTASIADVYNSESVAMELLRYTPVTKGISPREIPTLILSKNNSEDSKLFKTYKNIINKAGEPYLPLKFMIKKNGFVRNNIEEFVKYLLLVTNNNDFAVRDKKCTVEAVLPFSLKTNSEKMSPAYFSDLIKDHFVNGDLKIKDPEDSIISLIYGNTDSSGDSINVEGKHIIAFFGLLTYNDSLLLIAREGYGWDYDVPGGKRDLEDKTWKDTVKREVFEEIAFLIDKKRLGNIIGTVYDHKSAKSNGVPVIASYAHYQLNNEEYEEIVQMQVNSTKGFSIKFYDLTDLLEEKRVQKYEQNSIEPICHAPEHAIQWLCKELIPLFSKE